MRRCLRDVAHKLMRPNRSVSVAFEQGCARQIAAHREDESDEFDGSRDLSVFRIERGADADCFASGCSRAGEIVDRRKGPGEIDNEIDEQGLIAACSHPRKYFMNKRYRLRRLATRVCDLRGVYRGSLLD